MYRFSLVLPLLLSWGCSNFSSNDRNPSSEIPNGLAVFEEHLDKDRVGSCTIHLEDTSPQEDGESTLRAELLKQNYKVSETGPGNGTEGQLVKPGDIVLIKSEFTGPTRSSLNSITSSTGLFFPRTRTSTTAMRSGFLSGARFSMAEVIEVLEDNSYIMKKPFWSISASSKPSDEENITELESKKKLVREEILKRVPKCNNLTVSQEPLVVNFTTKLAFALWNEKDKLAQSLIDNSLSSDMIETLSINEKDSNFVFYSYHSERRTHTRFWTVDQIENVDFRKFHLFNDYVESHGWKTTRADKKNLVYSIIDKLSNEQLKSINIDNLWRFMDIVDHTTTVSHLLTKIKNAEGDIYDNNLIEFLISRVNSLGYLGDKFNANFAHLKNLKTLGFSFDKKDYNGKESIFNAIYSRQGGTSRVELLNFIIESSREGAVNDANFCGLNPLLYLAVNASNIRNFRVKISDSAQAMIDKGADITKKSDENLCREDITIYMNARKGHPEETYRNSKNVKFTIKKNMTAFMIFILSDKEKLKKLNSDQKRLLQLLYYPGVFQEQDSDGRTLENILTYYLSKKDAAKIIRRARKVLR